MRTERQRLAYYEQLANDYVGQAIIGRYRASIHLENQNDEWFWDSMLQKYSPGRYNFISYSRTPDGMSASGCTQCLLFRNYLSDKFFVCIDSDYRLLRREADLDAMHFILQTYTYSWENHYCYAEGLQERLAEIFEEKDLVFDFRSFLAAYSKVIYKPLLLFLYMERERYRGFSQKQFNGIMSLQYRKGDFDDNGAPIILRLSHVVEECCARIGRMYNFNLDAEKTYYAALGLTEDNAYLHVRGHNLYNMVLSVGNQLVDNFEFAVLRKNLAFDCYNEIKKTSRDIISLLS